MYYDPGFGNYTFNNQWSTMPDYGSSQVFSRQDAYDVYDINTNLPKALALIEDAVKGETEDRLFYQYMISMAPTPQEKNIIADIRDDEMKHYQLFREIYSELTGTPIPSVQDMTFDRPATYCAGLKEAMMGEQNAVTKYRGILYAMRDRRHINMLTEIITDELRHFGLYNYLYTRNGCSD
jgi:rubrerythrin